MMMKLAAAVLFAYLVGLILFYVLLEIYAHDCRQKHAKYVPTFAEKVKIALLWPYFLMFN